MSLPRPFTDAVSDLLEKLRNRTNPCPDDGADDLIVNIEQMAMALDILSGCYDHDMSATLLSIGSVENHIETYKNLIVENRQYRDKMKDEAFNWNEFLYLCESPIEKSFFLECVKQGLEPLPQFHEGDYRLDFSFQDVRVAVELDGHDYHKTKEQRTHDASRQRWLELNDWRVIRFTGTEIHHDVGSCVRQTIQFIAKVKEQRQHGSPTRPSI